MKQHVQALLALAGQDLEASRLMLTKGFVRVAISRAYYAAFHAAQAALLSVGEAPRSHAGVANRFYVRFVKTGLMEEEISRILPDAHSQRQGADYDALTVFDDRAAADLIADVKRFVETVALLLKEE